MIPVAEERAVYLVTLVLGSTSSNTTRGSPHRIDSSLASTEWCDLHATHFTPDSTRLPAGLPGSASLLMLINELAKASAAARTRLGSVCRFTIVSPSPSERALRQQLQKMYNEIGFLKGISIIRCIRGRYGRYSLCSCS